MIDPRSLRQPDLADDLGAQLQVRAGVPPCAVRQCRPGFHQFRVPGTDSGAPGGCANFIRSMMRVQYFGERVLRAVTAYTAGTTTSVSTIESSTPHMTTTPIDWRLSEPAPCATSNGIEPKALHRLVMSTGRRRVSEACLTAATNSTPRSRNWLANSTISTPFFAASPTSITIAIWLKMLIDIPYSHRPTMAPTIASGTVVMITNGKVKLSNWAASTRNTMSSVPRKVQ